MAGTVCGNKPASLPNSFAARMLATDSPLPGGRSGALKKVQGRERERGEREGGKERGREWREGGTVEGGREGGRNEGREVGRGGE